MERLIRSMGKVNKMYLIGERTFEMGGQGKKQKQIKDVENAFVVKDDIEYGALNVVPLWQFGLLY